MADNLTVEQRSRCMSRIRSKWTLQEKRIHDRLKGLKIKHKMHPQIAGRPDIVLPKSKTAVFLHGCFWHKCPRCYKEPKSNVQYWLPKIEKNVERDKANARLLKKDSWKVMRIWEHEIKNNFDSAVEKILHAKCRSRKK